MEARVIRANRRSVKERLAIRAVATARLRLAFARIYGHANGWHFDEALENAYGMLEMMREGQA